MEVFSSCLYELWQKTSVSWPQIHQPSRGLGSFYLDSNLNALVRSHPEISWNKMIITGFRHDFIYLAPCYYVAWLRLWKPKVWVKHHCFSWLCFPFVGVAFSMFSHWTLKPPRGKKQVTSDTQIPVPPLLVDAVMHFTDSVTSLVQKIGVINLWLNDDC